MNMVFQSFNLFSHLSVLGNLTLASIKLRGLSPAQATQKGHDLLKLVGLAEMADNFPEELSGGQKQRVAIARCLAMEPDIILFDEPTSALDPTMVSEVLAVTRRLAKDGMTMAIVTHEVDFARDVASRVLSMDEGLIYEQGTPAQIFENPQKEKPPAFVNRICSLRYQLASPDYGFVRAECRNRDLLRKAGFTQCHRWHLVAVGGRSAGHLPVTASRAAADVDDCLFREKRKPGTGVRHPGRSRQPA